MKGVISSLITFLTTFGTALIALFTQEGVSQFGDITEVAYAAAFLGALVAAANTYKAAIVPDVPWSAPKNKQKGFF